MYSGHWTLLLGIRAALNCFEYVFAVRHFHWQSLNLKLSQFSVNKGCYSINCQLSPSQALPVNSNMEHNQIKWKSCWAVSLMLLAYFPEEVSWTDPAGLFNEGSPDGYWQTGWAQGFWFSWGADRKLWGFRKSPFSMIYTDTTTNPLL